jgi:hypothetical protein
MLTSQAIRRQLAAMPHELYLIRLIHQQTRRPFPGERLWTAAQLLHPATIRFLRVRNREGCDIYVQPYAADQNAGYILIDLDRGDASVLEAMRSHGHDPCVVLQTSPGHLQAWIHLSASPLQPAVANAAARQLARAYGGDLGSADWRHLGRLAGFTNQKPARRTYSGYAPWVKIVHARAGMAGKADTLLQLVTALPPAAWLSSDASPVNGFSDDRSELANLTSVAAAQAIQTYRDCVSQWRIAERFPRPDWSIVDLWVVRRLLSQGMPTAQVQAILRLGSPGFPRRHGDPDDYLRRTLTHAAFPRPGRALCAAHARTSAEARSDSACSNSTGGR